MKAMLAAAKAAKYQVMKLTTEEKNAALTAMAQALVDQLFESENPYNCPHGRPTIISMTQYEVERKFKRV